MKTLENAAVSLEITKEPGCLVALRVHVYPEPTKKAYKNAVKTINKKISIPGFRKGRAPDSTIIERYSSSIDQEWKELIVKNAYKNALQLVEIYPINKNSVRDLKIESLSEKDGAIITFTYEHYPLLSTIDFSKISLPRIEKEPISDEKFKEIIEEVRQSQADWEEITGRPVQEGDYIDISIDAIDVDPPKSIAKERRFEVNKKCFAPWLMKLVLGMQVSEIIEGMSESDESEGKENFKPKKVRLTLHAIQKIILPELTDELAKKVGGESVEDIKAKIRANLEKEADNALYQKQIDALEEILLEKCSFDLPISLVKEESTNRMRAHLEALKKQGQSDEEIKNQEEEIEKEVAQNVDRLLRLYFINKQIAKQGHISLVNPTINKELNEELNKQALHNSYLNPKDMNKKESKEMVSRMVSSFLNHKTQEYALGQVLSKIA